MCNFLEYLCCGRRIRISREVLLDVLSGYYDIEICECLLRDKPRQWPQDMRFVPRRRESFRAGIRPDPTRRTRGRP